MSEAATVATPIESAPAPAPSLRDLSPTQRETWLKTGDLPASEPDAASDSAPAPTGDDSQPAGETQPPVETAAEPARPEKKAKPRDDFNARIGQLTERAKKAEQERDELRAKLEAAAKPAPSASEPSAPSTPKAPTRIELVKKYQSEPDWPGDVQAFADAGFDDAYGAMLAAQSAYIGEKLWAEREAERAAHVERERRQTVIDKTWSDFKAKYPDADPNALADVHGPSEKVLARLIFESPSSVDLLNYFSSNPAEARTVAAMEPVAAAHFVGKVESRLSTPAPSRIAAPTKTVSSAPEPIQTLGARHTPNAGDELEQAIRDKDTGRYIELANKRELAEMKAGRR